MLERVSSSAECATHTFLRCFERPIRSHRTLEPSFWRHGSDSSNVPAWWPTYLDGIRNKGQDSAYMAQTNVAGIPMLPVTRRRDENRSSSSPTRAFAGLLMQARVASSQALPARFETEDPGVNHQAAALYSREAKIIANHGKEMLMPEGRRSRKKPQTNLKVAWDDFARAGWKDSKASALLHLLATDSKRSSFERALRAFQYIPKAQRSAQDYYVATDIAIRLNRYSAVTQMIKEAVAGNSNHEVFFKYLALCVSKGLWNMAAELWRQVGQAEDRTLRLASHSWDSRKQNFAGKYISYFDAVEDLPSKLVAITARLHEADPVLNHKRDLVDLCQSLTLLAVESETVMNAITGQELLSLFAIGEQLESVANLHFAAIATISRMPDKGSKGSLAALIYRNYRYRHPQAFMPNWVFGTIIGIYSAGRQPTALYRSLLDDYKSTYTVLEDTIYLQIMRACATQGEADFVRDIYVDFCKHSMPKSPDDINPLIRVYAVTGDSRAAQEQFDRLHTQYNFKPSVRNWNSLILAYSRSGDQKKAYRVFDKMKSQGAIPDEHSWSLIVALAAKRGDTKYAKALVRQSENAGISPPLAMIGAVVDSCLASNKPDEAWPLVIEVSRAVSKLELPKVSPIRLWNSLFRYYAFRSDSEAIFQTQERMKQFDVQADSMTYAALMTALVVQKRTEDATKILHTMRLNPTLSANEFHYSILVHGFAMERKRDRAQEMYHEMLRKFSRVTLSAKLAMLHLQATRAEDKAMSQYLSGNTYRKPDFRSTAKFLEGILVNTSPTDLTSQMPNPGFKRRSPQRDLEPIFFGSLIAFLQRNDAHELSNKMIEALEKDHNSQAPGGLHVNPSWMSALDTLTQKLEIAIHAQDWQRFSKTWQEAINSVFANCTPVDLSESGLIPQSHTSDRTQITKNIAIVDPYPMSLIPRSTLPKGIRILPAYRYVLSRHLSQCILALDRQQKYAEMIQLIRTLRGYGLGLSNKNLNSLIQALCRSPNLEHGIFAYELFERQLLPNAPTWNVIRRGKWVQPMEEKPQKKWDALLKKQDKRKYRQLLEGGDPGLAMPSYFTMIHMAIVWLKVSRPRSRSDHIVRRRLENQTPGTVKLVLKTPYLKDKIQGVLLRGQRSVGDRVKRPRHVEEFPGPVDFQGNQYLVDCLSPYDRADLEAGLPTESTDAANQDLPQAEKLFGEINRSFIVLPSKGRVETHSERRKRIANAKLRKLEALHHLRREARRDMQVPSSPIVTNEQAYSISWNPDTDSGRASLAPGPQRADLLRGVSSILDQVASSSLHDSGSFPGPSGKSDIRTDITGRQAVRMSRPSSEWPHLSVQPRRLAKLRTRTQARKSVDGHNNVRSSPDISSRARVFQVKHLKAWNIRRGFLKRLQRMATSLTKRFESLQCKSLRRPILSRNMALAIKRLELTARRASERALAASAVEQQHPATSKKQDGAAIKRQDAVAAAPESTKIGFRNEG